MIEQIVIDELTSRGVSVRQQQYILHNGTQYPVGEPHRRAYANTERGRAELAGSVPEPYLSAVMAVWGDAPQLQELEEE